MKKIKILIIGLVLLPAIAFAQTDASSVISRNLHRGMTGGDVKQLQQLLAADSTIYPEGLITGYFGVLTEKAIKAFQERNGIESVGRVGPQTLEKVNVAIKNNEAGKIITKFAVGDTQAVQPQTPIYSPAVAPSAVSASTEHYIIRYKQAPGKNEEDSLRTSHKANVRHTYQVIPAISADMDTTEASKLSSDPNVLSVEVDRKVQIRDLEFSNTWGVNHIGASTVQNNGVTGNGIKIAVLDTGIDYNHPELVGEYAGGYNFVSGNTDPMDDNGHGTHVAGTIAAAHDGVGVVGAAPKVRLYALKVLDASGSGYASSIIAAIDWAIANGIQITNNSYGSDVDLGTSVNEAFAKAEQAGILSVASAGNSGTCAGDTDSVDYPARYSSVIAVAATDANDVRPCFSSTGSKIELAAPGVNINSTKLGGGYITYNGTSMAAPHVTGTAALVFQAEIVAKQNPTNTSVRQILDNTATDIGLSGRDTSYGFGLVSADNAVAAILSASTTTPNTSSSTQPVATTTPNTSPNYGFATSSPVMPSFPFGDISSASTTNSVDGTTTSWLSREMEGKEHSLPEAEVEHRFIPTLPIQARGQGRGRDR